MNRPPWEADVASSGSNFPSIDLDEQQRRDAIRLRMLQDELSNPEVVNDPRLAQALMREIDSTKRNLGPAAQVTPSSPSRPPWEVSEAPAPTRRKGKYDYLLPSEMPAQEEGPGFFRRGADIAVKGLSGIPSALSAGVGLIGTVAPFARGATDPLAELYAESAQAIDKSLLSEYQLQKQKELSRRLAAAPGFFESAGEAASFLGENPLYALPMIAESVPMMYGGGAIGQGLRSGMSGVGLRAVSPMTSAAIGEGALIAGGVGTDIARQDPNASRIPAIVAGAGGAAVSRLGGRIMGASDIDTAIAARMARGELTDVLTPAGTAGGRVVRGVIGEGLLEEAPQSAIERMALNYSGGRPLMEGVGGEMVLGAASGGLMGGGFGLRRPGGTYTPDELSAAQAVLEKPDAEPMNKIGAADFIRRVETGTLGEAEANRRFNDTLNSIFTSADLAANKTVDILNPQPTLGGMRGVFAAGPQGMIPEGVTSTAGPTDETIQQWRARVGYGPNVWRGVQTPGQEWRESVQGGPNVWRYPVARGLVGSSRGLFAGGPEAMGQPRPVMGGISDTGGRAAALAGPSGLPVVPSAQQRQAPGGTPAAVSPAAPAAGGLLDIPYDTVEFAGQGQPLRRSSGKSSVINLGGRMVVMRNVNGVTVPFYLSSGQGGKTDVPAGKWYPFFGIGADGWINKTGGKEMTSYYGSEALKQAAEELDNTIGDIRNDTSVPRVGRTGQHIDFINQGLSPTENNTADTLTKVKENINRIVSAVEAGKATTSKTTKGKKATTTKGAKKAPPTLSEQLEDELDLADAELDEARTKQIVADVGKEKMGAEVQGAKQIKAPPGAPTLGTSRLVAIRNALLSKTGRMSKGTPAKDKKAVDALRAFAEAYNAYQNATTDAIRDAKYGKQQLSEEKLANLQKLANDTRNALFAVGQALDNNAKNVEAVVRVVKDAVQRKLAKPGKTKQETLDALQSMDTMLSSAWTAAKRETFMGETADMADVSGQLIRPSEEKQAKGEKKSQLEKAADGYSRPPYKGKVSPTWVTYYGLAGIMQYLSFNTTPMGKVLAAALRDALHESSNPVKVEFTDTGGSRYDPKTNTVYINRNEQSAEVAIHEAFHAALQWYVYQNPDAPAVKSLQKSLEKALAAEGLQGKALEVQQILQDLVNNKRGLDAVLELVSYNATLNDFRKAMQQLKGGDAPASFWGAATKLWRDFKTLVRTFLGVNDSVASDILAASMELLEESRSNKNKMPEKLTGGVLKADVQSNKATQTAAGVTALDMRTFTQRIAPEALSTRFLFDALGWETRVTKPVQAGMTKLAELIRKEFPAAERFLILMNSTFSAGEFGTKALADFRFDKNVGYQQMERLTKFVENRPGTEALALMSYMDGNKKALDSFADKEVLTRTADNVMQWFKAYVAELPESERRFFNNRKFSESLLYATRSEQIARSTVGAQKLSSVMALKHRTETTLEGFKDWMAKDENGDIDLDGRFYQVFKTEGLKPDGGPEPAGFMSISEFEKLDRKSPVGFQVDATRDWWISQYTEGEKYKFSSSMTAKQAIDEGKADQLANAMRNTFSALAVNYASKRLFQNLATAGYEDGKPTALSIAFDSIDDLNKLMKDIGGKVVSDDKVLQVSDRMARSPEIINMYRRSGRWVQLPDTDTYGALAGKIVHGPVWSAILDTSDKQPVVKFKAYNDVMRWFKKSKTVYNPGTHVTNIASNFTLAMMHDIPVTTLAKAARMFALYEVSPNKLTAAELDMVSAFMNSGAMLGDYSSAEVKQALYDAWEKNLSDDDNATILSRLGAFANYEKSKTKAFTDAAKKLGKEVDDIIVETYTAEDNVFRLAAFLTKVGDLQNMEGNKEATPEQLRIGGDFAREAFLDYDIDSKAVRIARQSVLPFVSWTYAILPVLGRMALHQPWKFANVITALYIMEAALAAAAGGGDDDEETRKMGPEYIRDRMLFGMGPHMFFRMPGGDAENPVYYKIGDYIPFASMTKGLPNGIAGQSWVPGAVTPGGPFLTAAVGIIAGVDPYTGKSIHQPTDSEWDKFLNAAKFGYDTFSPSFMSSRNINKVKDIIDEKVGITGAEPSNLVFARMMGLKMYDFNVSESLAIQDKRIKGIERDFKSAMKKAKEEEYRKGYPDYESLDKELETLRERMEERKAKVRGEDLEGEE